MAKSRSFVFKFIFTGESGFRREQPALALARRKKGIVFVNLAPTNVRSGWFLTRHDQILLTYPTSLADLEVGPPGLDPEKDDTAVWLTHCTVLALITRVRVRLCLTRRGINHERRSFCFFISIIQYLQLSTRVGIVHYGSSARSTPTPQLTEYY